MFTPYSTYLPTTKPPPSNLGRFDPLSLTWGAARASKATGFYSQRLATDQNFQENDYYHLLIHNCFPAAAMVTSRRQMEQQGLMDYLCSSIYTNRRNDHVHHIQVALTFTRSMQHLLSSITWTLSHAICVSDFNRKCLLKTIQRIPFFRVANMSKLCSLFFITCAPPPILLNVIIDLVMFV